MKDMRIPTLLIASVLFAQGCASAAGPSEATLGEPFTLSYGDVAQVDGLTVGFNGVSQDSRCPIDVVCVWQGDATVLVTLETAQEASATRELHTGIEPRETGFAGFTVRLVSVAPAARSNVKIDAEDYRATLLVTR
jgi:hypothetical protein